MYNRDKIIKTLREITAEPKDIKPYVVVAQPRRSFKEPAAQKLDGYQGIHIDMLGYSHGFVNVEGEVVDVARNYLFEEVLQIGAKYMLFVGDDTVIPWDGFLRLHEVAEKNPDAVVCGVYYIKLSSAMVHVKKGDWIVPANVDPGQIFEAWQTGMDCMLIPVDIIRKIKEDDPEIPFCCIANNIEDIPFVGEDNFFVYRLRKLGFRLLVNTDVQCLHMDVFTGKYTAHPSVNLNNYFTNIPITTPLTMEDKHRIDKSWVDRAVKKDVFVEFPYLSQVNGIDKPVENLLIDYTKDTENTVIGCMKKVKTTQNYYEVSRLCERLKTLKPKTILEIGVEAGGTLTLWSEFADKDAMYIGVDNDSNVNRIEFKNMNQKISFICGDSTKEETLQKVKEALSGRGVDFLFIDGGHDEATVRSDFQKYSPLVTSGGIIALHDINTSANKDACIGVNKLWNEIKETYTSTEEFINTESGLYFGIGMIRWK